MVKLRSRVSLSVADLKEATDVIVRNHYLHRGRTMAQMPYWVHLDSERAGVLLFSLPRISAAYQGRSPMSIIELARMWLSPRVQEQRIKDSGGKEHALAVASCAIAKGLRRIRQDWHGKYPHLPMIEACVSWADDTRHEGTIYRASNFREIGKTARRKPKKHYRRVNGGRSIPREDAFHVKTAFFYLFPRSLSLRQKQEAQALWTGRRPRVSDKQLLRLAVAEGTQPVLFPGGAAAGE